MSEFSRETLLNIIETDHVQCGEASALARMALAAMDSEPVAFTEKHEISNMHATGLYLRAWPADRARNAVEGYTIPLYRHAPPAPERDQVRREHAEWSQATFGNVGPVGPLKHLSKEALDAAAGRPAGGEVMSKVSTVGEIVRSDMEQSGALRKRYWQSSSLPFREKRKHRPQPYRLRRDRVLQKIMRREMEAMVNRLSQIDASKILEEVGDA